MPLSPAQADPQRGPSSECTIIGTPGPDKLTGTNHDDFICGLGGNDKINGRNGDDTLQGGGGDDTIVGGPGNDVLGGGRGDDTLDAVDSGTAKDRLRCGRGRDTARADVPDVVRKNCETVDQDDAPTDLSLAPSSVAENQPVGTSVGTLSAVDPDPGDTHTFTLVAGTGSTDNGSFTIVGATLRTTASLDFETSPTRSVRVRATDSGGLSVEKAFTVTVTDVDDPPVAVDDTKTVTEDAVATAIDVLANDTDVDAGPKTIASVTQPAHGTVAITGGGSGLTYEPDADYCNTPPPSDDFTYTLNGGDVGAVAVTVSCVDDPAVANDDTSTVVEDAAATPVDVLANDSDVEGDPFSVTAVGAAAHGTTSFTAADVSYQPAANYCGSDSFSYTITGGDTANVAVAVTCVNDAPHATDDTLAETEDIPLVFPAGDLLVNDTDPDVGDTLTVTAVSNPTNGTVGLTAGSITFTPTTNACTPTQGGFDYTLSDGVAADTGHVTVTISCINDAPVAVDDAATVFEDSATLGMLVQNNDTDAEGDPITITGVTDPAHGTTTFNAVSVTYKPDADYCNTPSGPTDDFDYTINGGDTGKVSMTVTCVNDAPVIDLDNTAGGSGSTVTFTETDPHTGSGVLIAPNATVTDVDSNIVTMAVSVNATPDTVSEKLTATGTANITVTPYSSGTRTLLLNGSASPAEYQQVLRTVRYDNSKNPPSSVPDRTVSVNISDGALLANATATVHVTPLNAPPVNTVPGAQTTAEDTSKAITGISVADADDASLTEQLTVTNGTLTLASTAGLSFTVGDGTTDTTMTFSGTKAAINTALASVSYIPTANFNGGSVLTLTSTDAGAASDTDTVNITVTSVNDQPVAAAHTVTTSSGLGLTINAATDANDLKEGATDADDPAGDLTVQLVAGSISPANATVTLLSATDGSFYVEPPGGVSGPGAVTFAFKVCDDNGGDPNQCSAQKTLTVDVSGADRWFVDDADAAACAAACNGSRSKPLVGLAALPGGRGTGDSIFLFSGSYSGGHTFQNGETLVGQGATGSFDTLLGVTVPGNGTLDARPALGGTKPTLGNTVTLATNATLRGVLVSSGATAGLTDPAGATTGVTVTQTSVTTTTGTAILLDQVGGTLGFDAVTHTGGSGAGVSVTTNAAALTFGGGLSISSGTSPAFTVTGGGSVSATQDNVAVVNTLSSTTGSALTVSGGTALGATGLTFRSISSNGAASGIVLNGTGVGGLAVTGNGGTCSSAATCSGGAIQGSTGPGVSLTTVPGGVSLTRLAVTGGADDGIRATTVNDVDLTDSVVLNNGDSHALGAEERGLDYLNVTGTPQILRTTVSGSNDSNAHVENTTAGSTTLSVDTSAFSDSKASAGLRIRGGGTSTMTATVQNSTFSLNADAGFSMQTDASNTAHQTLLFDNNSVSGGSTNAVSARPQVTINTDSGSVGKVTISNNHIKSGAGAEIIINSQAGQTAAGSLDAKVVNNTINDAQTGAADVPADGGSSIWGSAHGDGATRIEIRNNTVANWGGRALELSHNDGNGTADFTATGNTFSTPDATPNTFEGMYIYAGAATGDTSNVCVDLENNDVDGIGRQGASDLAIDRFGTASLRFADFNDTSVPNLQTNLRGKNPASAALTVETFSAGPTATAATSCTLTTGTP